MSDMTPEQTKYFLDALMQIILAAADGKITAPQFRSAVLFLWMSRGPGNGYVNVSHPEAWSICGTNANSTMRAHLISLRDCGVIREYSTNGTVRLKFAQFPGRELITHPRRSLDEQSSSLDEQSSSLDEQLSTNERLSSSYSARHRALSELVRALYEHPSRKFDDYPQSDPAMLLLLNNNNNIQTSGGNNSNKPTPVEAAISISLLVQAGMWRNVAKPLAQEYPLAQIRQAVCEFITFRNKYRSIKIIEAWLREGAPLMEVNEQFRHSDLYRNHRTKDEIAADDDAEIEMVSPIIDLVDDPDPPESDESPDDDLVNLWRKALYQIQQQIPSSTYNTYLLGTYPNRLDDETNTLVICCADRYQTEFVASRLRQMILRTLRSITGQSFNLELTHPK